MNRAKKWPHKLRGRMACGRNGDDGRGRFSNVTVTGAGRICDNRIIRGGREGRTRWRNPNRPWHLHVCVGHVGNSTPKRLEFLTPVVRTSSTALAMISIDLKRRHPHRLVRLKKRALVVLHLRLQPWCTDHFIRALLNSKFRTYVNNPDSSGWQWATCNLCKKLAR